jgi:purine nucleoside permease
MSEWAEWWVKKWTKGQGTYCMTNMEDFGTLTALERLSDEGLIDWNRIMVLRAASNMDQQHPGQTALESLNTFQTGGLPLALENVYRVGSVVAKHILDN